ncbi:hypothetical protein C1645_825467 [Glomus cerebriforme]|uniref:Uncharacterized protein n=1 Tax=Glomus cerebriforme TaxID=658196 RepID=A0A397SSE2_9GLOM|nr:hypothetical protein C1645_825467 [Glomus cerebriforme]
MEQPPLHPNVPYDNELINDKYDNCFPQPSADTFQPNPCSCNNCLSTLPYDNNNNTFTTSNSIIVSDPPLQQYINNNVNEKTLPISTSKEEQRNNGQQITDQLQPVNSQTNYIEIFKVEISGFEIVVRKKLLFNLNDNLEIHQAHQQNEQSPSITNRTGRIQNNRMHPYQIPTEHNCRHNNVNNNNNNKRNPNSSFSCPSNMTPQLNHQIHISGIDQTYTNQ